MSTRILCAVDLTHMDDARKLVAEAGRLATFDGAALSLVTVLPDYCMSFVGSFFKDGSGWVHDTGVDVAQFPQSKKIGSMLCAVKLIGSGLIDRDSDRTRCWISAIRTAVKHESFWIG